MTDLLAVVAARVHGAMPSTLTVKLDSRTRTETPIEYLNMDHVRNARAANVLVDITPAEIAEAERQYAMELAGLTSQIRDAHAHPVQAQLSSMELLSTLICRHWVAYCTHCPGRSL